MAKTTALGAATGLREIVRLIQWVVKASLWCIRVLSWGAATIATVYGATIVYGLIRGDALPPATIFALVPSAHHLSGIAPFIPWFILVVAGVGASSGWAATIGLLSPSELHTQETKLIRFWVYAGFPVIALTFLFAMSGGGWSGHFAETDFNYMSVGGLVPNSDAKAYYASAADLAYLGHWDEGASRRPFAAALRGLVELAGGLSYPGTLIVQAILIAGAMMFVLRSVVAWRGIWVGLALFAFLYGLARPFLLTTMTEPLGFLWSLFSLAFFIEALRQESVAPALVGFAALVCGLMTRMGSMLTIPFLMLWIPLAFAKTRVAQIKIFATLTIITLVIIAWNDPLAHLYARSVSDVGGNFADTVCGLARGTDWAECDRGLATQLATIGTPHDRNVFLYLEALHTVLADPSHLFRKLWENLSSYTIGFSPFLITQYIPIAKLNNKTIYELALLLIPGWIYLFYQKKNWKIIEFFLIILVSTMLSASIIFSDDGTRALHVTHPFIAAIFAIGLSAPMTLCRASDGPMLSWRWGAATIVILLGALLVGPPIASAAIRWVTDFGGRVTADAQDVRIVAGHPLLTGFLVLPDATALPPDVPALHASTFARVFEHSFKLDFGPNPYVMPPAPFAVIDTEPQSDEAPGHTFLTPPQVLTFRQANRWRFEINMQDSPPFGAPFFLVRNANPLQ
jgi:hypothetical protein